MNDANMDTKGGDTERQRGKEVKEWRRRIEEERKIDDMWRSLVKSFEEKKYCRVCGKEISEHRYLPHRFVPNAEIDEEITDEKKLKVIHYYLCMSGGELFVKRVTRPDKSLVNREYTVHEELHDAPPWLQRALIAGGRLKEFLESVRGAEGQEERMIGELIEDLPPYRRPRADEGRTKAESIDDLLGEIWESADRIWDNTPAIKECMISVKMAFGSKEHCRICGHVEGARKDVGHGFIPKIEVDKDVTDEREIMREEQYLCIHESRMCIKRVMFDFTGEEHVSYEDGFPPWEYDFLNALFATGRIVEFLRLVRDRLGLESEEYEQIAECDEKLPKAGKRILRRFGY